MTHFELFAFWRSSATFRVRVALNLKGLSAHEQMINLDADEQHGEAFRKVSPLGTLPALVQEGHAPLTQSLAILEFLDEQQPSPPLLPGDLYGRARVRSIASMCTADMHPLVVPRVKHYLLGNGFDAAAWRAWQIKWFGTGLEALERRLASEPETGDFCHGNEPTMADICLASIIAITRVFKIKIDDTPTIDRIMANCDRHEAFMKADPSRQEGAPE
jgi:maleylacetoacetate isomerase